MTDTAFQSGLSPVVGALTYGLAALGYSAGALLIAFRWRSGRISMPMLVAFALAALWSIWLAIESANLRHSGTATYVLEFLRYAGIFLLVGKAVTDKPLRSLRPAISIAALWVGLLAISLLTSSDSALTQELSQSIDLYAASMIILAALGLALVETAYRNTSSRERWAVKYLWLGVATILVFDLYFFANYMLYRRVDLPTSYARGLINAMAVALMLVSVVRISHFRSQIFISRKVAFYSTSLVIAGAFLIFTAVGGYYVKNYSGTWGKFAQLIFLFAALTAFASVMISGQTRARLSVFIAKHFYSHKYDYREKWLQLVTALTADEGLKPLASHSVNALAEIVQSPAGGIWVRGATGAYYPVGGELAGETAAVIEADDPMVQRLGKTDWIVELDKQSVVRGAIAESFPDWITSNRAYWLIVPVQGTDGLRAIVVLAQPRVDYPLEWEDFDLLKVVARQVGGYLDLEVAAETLAEAMQFHAHSKLTAFIMHDIKNVIAQLSLMIQNATQHRGNPEFMDDVIATVENSVSRMRFLLESLESGRSAGAGRRVNVTELCEAVIRRKAERRPVPVLAAPEHAVYAVVDPERFMTILGHIIGNAQDASQESGKLSLSIETSDGSVLIHVDDEGTGMDRDFIRDRLFRPFDSTKGTKGMGIGAFQARDYIQSIGGNVEVQSQPGVGTRFTLQLPRLAESADFEPQGQSA